MIAIGDPAYMKLRSTGRFLAPNSLLRMGAHLLGLGVISIAACFIGLYFSMPPDTAAMIYEVGMTSMASGVGLLIAFTLRHINHYKPNPRHMPGHPERGKQWYSYELHDDAPDCYSLHVRAVKSRLKDRTSDVSIVRYPEIVLGSVIQRIGKGKTLVLVTPNERLRKAMLRSEARIVAAIPTFAMRKEHSVSAGYLIGQFANIRHGYGLSLFRTVQMKGIIFPT